MDKRVIWSVILSSVVIIGVGIFFAGKATKPTPTPLDTSVLTPKELEVQNSDHVKGSANAPITLVEYGDFQCPSCGAYHPLVSRLSTEFGDKLRIVFRHYPLTQIHEHAWAAAKASEAAAKQGKFWEMYDALFEKQSDWSKTKDETASFSDIAKSIGLNVEQFKKDAASSEAENRVHADQVSGDTLGVNGTPTFYVNGHLITLPGSYEAFKGVIDSALTSVTPKPTPVSTEIHEHADFALFVNGKKFNLSDKKYDEKNPSIHIHDGYGDMIHKHKSGATMGDFYSSLGLAFAPSEMYVNGTKFDNDWKSYEFKDTDRIALSTSALSPAQLGVVSDKACIYSEKCPERGKPPTENCVGGLGTGCDK